MLDEVVACLAAMDVVVECFHSEYGEQAAALWSDWQGVAVWQAGPETAECPHARWRLQGARTTSWCSSTARRCRCACASRTSPAWLQGHLDQHRCCCLQAADNAVYVMETVGSVAQRHGFVASWHPKPLADECATGLHVHWSIQQVSCLPRCPTTLLMRLAWACCLGTSWLLH